MNVVGYVGCVVVVSGIGYGVKWIDPSALAHLSRRTGLTGRKAWAITVATLLWVFLPILAGAAVGGEERWAVGAAVGGTGVFLTTIAAGSVDEYRLLRRVPHRRPAQIAAGGPDTLVVTSGDPTPVTGGGSGGDRPETPFTGDPAVHTDWLVQR